MGHAHPAIVEAISERARLGTHFAAPTEDGIVVAEELARRFGLPKWRFTNSGSEATMDAIRIARGLKGRDTIMKIFGSYHGHHDGVMVAVGVSAVAPTKRRLESRPGRDPVVPVRRRRSAGSRRPDGRGPVQRRRRARAAARPPRAGGAQAGLPDHGGGDDEPRGRAARAGLPRGRARDHEAARRRAHLRRGQDWARDRSGRRDRALRRPAGHGHAREDARRRAPVGRDRRHRRGDGGRRERDRVPGRHVQRQPADDGGRARRAARGPDPRGVPASRQDQRPARGRLPGGRRPLPAARRTRSGSARRAA